MTCQQKKITCCANCYTSNQTYSIHMVFFHKNKTTPSAILGIPYLPMHNALLCIMRNPILKPVFRKKNISTTSFLTKNNFLEKFSRNVNSSSTCTKISYRSWCKSFNVLSDQWHMYIKFYDVFFIFFCCFTAAQLNVIYLHKACNIFMNEESWN